MNTHVTGTFRMDSRGYIMPDTDNPSLVHVYNENNTEWIGIIGVLKAKDQNSSPIYTSYIDDKVIGHHQHLYGAYCSIVRVYQSVELERLR